MLSSLAGGLDHDRQDSLKQVSCCSPFSKGTIQSCDVVVRGRGFIGDRIPARIDTRPSDAPRPWFVGQAPTVEPGSG